MKIIDLDGKEIDYVVGMSVREEGGVYYLMNEEQMEANKPSLRALRIQKLEALEAAYTSAQWIKLKANYDFVIPLKGDFFNVLLTNQIFAAQVIGYASLILQDQLGQTRVLENIAFEKWKEFYTVAKDISFSNLILKNQKILEINAASNADQIDAISLDVFPAIQQIVIQI